MSTIRSAETQQTNQERLYQWKIRWRMATGLMPATGYAVAFCRTCNKPHWIHNAQHKHLTARCAGH